MKRIFIIAVFIIPGLALGPLLRAQEGVGPAGADDEKSDTLEKDGVPTDEDEATIEDEKRTEEGEDLRDVTEDKEEKIDEGADTEIEEEAEERESEETEIPEKEEPAKKDRRSPIHQNENEYIGFILNYGGFMPVADYGGQYELAHYLGIGIPVYYVTMWGISPEFHVRYSRMESKPRILYYDSEITLVQFFPALVYRHDFELPGSFKGPISPYVRIYDGLTRVAYESFNPYLLFLGKQEIVEYINVFGLSAGLNLYVYKGLFLGFDVGYSVIATAEKPLQSVSFMLNFGYRIF